MSTKTYNAGRVVGWSSYEEFLKQNPGVDITEEEFITVTTYGAARAIELPIKKSNNRMDNGWVADGKLFKITVEIPGASWGVVPIIGLNYDEYQTKDRVPNKVDIEKCISSIFTCTVTNQQGVKPINRTSVCGYLTFWAYPDIFESNLDRIPLIIRGLGMEAAITGKIDGICPNSAYYGPQGFVFAGNAFSFMTYGSKTYERALPEGGVVKALDQEPLIDMRTTDPEEAYTGSGFLGNSAKNITVPVDIRHLQTYNDQAAVLAVYNRTKSEKDGTTAHTPALYGFVTEPVMSSNPDNNKIVKAMPIDCVAPGSLKLFDLSERNESEEAAQERIKTLESVYPYVHGFYRDDVGVIWEYDPNKAESAFPPVSKDYTENINGLMTAGTDWIYPFRMHTGGTNPDFKDMVNDGSNGWIRLDRSAGFFSQEFIAKYGLTYKEWGNFKKHAQNLGIGIYGDWWEALTNNDNLDAWVAVPYFDSEVIKDPRIRSGSDLKTCTYYLIEKATGAYSVVTNGQYYKWGLPVFNYTSVKNFPDNTEPDQFLVPAGGYNYDTTFNISVGDVKYTVLKTDFLGTWWNRKSGLTDASSKTVLTTERHHFLKDTAKIEGRFFYQSDSLVPWYDDSKYEDFRAFYKNIRFSEVCAGFGLNESDILAEKYRNMSYYDILLLAGICDLKKDIPYNDGVGSRTHYVYPKDIWSEDPNTYSSWNRVYDIESDGRQVLNTNGYNGKVDVTIDDSDANKKKKNQRLCAFDSGEYVTKEPALKIVEPSSSDVFAMRFWKMYGKDSNKNWLVDLTSSVNRSDSPIWASISQSGHEKHAAVSLVDRNGFRLVTAGTAGDIDANRVNWGDLLAALNTNKSVDVLGGFLREMKSEGKDYLKKNVVTGIKGIADNNPDYKRGEVSLSSNDIGSVSYYETQNLEKTQQITASMNMGAVTYLSDEKYKLSKDQQKNARENIDAAPTKHMHPVENIYCKDEPLDDTVAVYAPIVETSILWTDPNDDSTADSYRRATNVTWDAFIYGMCYHAQDREALRRRGYIAYSSNQDGSADVALGVRDANSTAVIKILRFGGPQAAGNISNLAMFNTAGDIAQADWKDVAQGSRTALRSWFLAVDVAQSFSDAEKSTARNNIEAAAADHTHQVDSALDRDSTNPVQNKVVYKAIDDVNREWSTELGQAVSSLQGEMATKVTAETGKGLSSNDFTKSYKDKIDNLPSTFVTGVKGANKSYYSSGDVSISANDVGGVSFLVAQSLDADQKARARANIGVSDFDGNYNNLSNKPTMVTGVKGSNQSSYSSGQVELDATDVSAVSYSPNQGLTDTRRSNARKNISAVGYAYNQQLTANQQLYARSNISAAKSSGTYTDTNGNTYSDGIADEAKCLKDAYSDKKVYTGLWTAALNKSNSLSLPLVTANSTELGNDAIEIREASWEAFGAKAWAGVTPHMVKESAFSNLPVLVYSDDNVLDTTNSINHIITLPKKLSYYNLMLVHITGDKYGTREYLLNLKKDFSQSNNTILYIDKFFKMDGNTIRTDRINFVKEAEDKITFFEYKAPGAELYSKIEIYCLYADEWEANA